MSAYLLTTQAGGFYWAGRGRLRALPTLAAPVPLWTDRDAAQRAAAALNDHYRLAGGTRALRPTLVRLPAPRR
jgi:hypothetical protein